MSAFNVKIDVLELEGAASRLERLDAAAINRAATRAVRSVSEVAFVDAKKRVNKTLNLSDAWVDQRMKLQAVTQNGNRASATISAVRARETSLRNFDPVQMVTPVRFTNADIASRIGTPGMNPRKPGTRLLWKERIGDTSRGIAVDQKANGINVQVTRGAPKRIASAFSLRLRGSGINGIVRRDAAGRIKVLYGPAVYQSFRNALPVLNDEVETNLRSRVIVELDKELET